MSEKSDDGIVAEQHALVAMELEARKLSPKELIALRNFATAQLQEGNYPLAALQFSTLYRVGGETTDFLRCAISLRLSGDLNRADELFSEFSEKHGATYTSNIEAGLCKLARAQFGEATALFKRAVEANPTPQAKVLVGISLGRQHQVEDALTWFSDALVSDPELLSAKLEMGHTLFHADRYNEAISVYEGITNSPPSSTPEVLIEQVHDRLGTCYDRLQRSESIRALLQDTRLWTSIVTPIHAANVVGWSLKVSEPVSDEIMIDLARRLHDKPGYREFIDVLTLRVVDRMRSGKVALEAYEEALAKSVYGRSALAVLRSWTFSDVVRRIEELEMEDIDSTTRSLSARIRKKEPASLIRLGDGEGNVLATQLIPENEFILAQSDKILRNWFGPFAKPISHYQNLLGDLEETITNADYVGIPDVRRIEKELVNIPRGYWGVYFSSTYVSRKRGNPGIIFAGIHSMLFRSKEFLDSLCENAEVNTISCHSKFGQLLRTTFKIPNGTDLVVPGEMGIRQLPKESKDGDHYGAFYALVLDSISRLAPGSVTLIAAGICGKVYADAVRRSGGIGVDIGAMADFFMKVPTREPFTHPEFVRQYAWYDSVGTANSDLLEPDELPSQAAGDRQRDGAERGPDPETLRARGAIENTRGQGQQCARGADQP